MLESMFDIPEPLEEQSVMQVGDLSELAHSSLEIYTDGSGGKYSSCPKLARAGWAWNTMNESYTTFTFVRFSKLAGAAQTVPRSELSAALDALKFINADVDLHFIVDATYVSKIGTQLIEIYKSSSLSGQIPGHSSLYGINADLWCDFYQEIGRRNGRIAFSWSKSHATAHELHKGFVCKEYFLGNSVADAFADKAADLHQLSDAHIAEYEWMVARTALVRKRLLLVMKRVQEFDAKEKLESGLSSRQENEVFDQGVEFVEPGLPAKTPSSKTWSSQRILSSLRVAGHDPVEVHTKTYTVFRCKTCKLQATPKKVSKLLLLGDCAGLGQLKPIVTTASGTMVVGKRLSLSDDDFQSLSSVCKVARVDTGTTADEEVDNGAAASSGSGPASQRALQPPMVGNLRLHDSHRLEHRKGIIICQLCGYYSVSRPGLLAKLCVPLRRGVKSGGRDFLSRWTKGLTPKKSMSWPDNFSNLPDGVIWTPPGST